MKKVSEEQAYVFTQFIASRSVVIVDPQLSSRAGLTKTLIGLGAQPNQIGMASTVTDGREEIQRRSPHIVLCEYDLGKSCGLELLQTLRAQHPGAKDWLFFLLTSNTSQSAVARAAEEDVDGFILKPYTLEIMRQTIMKIALGKLHPSEYVKAIDAGKALLEQKKFDEALARFDQALKLDAKPSLAHYYRGQVELLKTAVAEAEGDFQSGLEHNKIHYKCMVGLFDLFMEQKRYKDAYEVVKRLSRYFPSNPQRLATVLRLAIMNQGYEDIERYYQVFCSIEQRNDELVKYVCAALVVCGKYYLQSNFPTRAQELFQKAAITAGGKTRILREVIVNLCEYELHSLAKAYLQRYPAETQSQTDFLAMQYLIHSELQPVGVTVEQGRKLIRDGHGDLVVYQVLIRKSVVAKFREAAEMLVLDAIKLWPDRKSEFEAMIPHTPA